MKTIIFPQKVATGTVRTSPRPTPTNLRAALEACSQEVPGLWMFPYAILLRKNFF